MSTIKQITHCVFDMDGLLLGEFVWNLMYFLLFFLVGEMGMSDGLRVILSKTQKWN